MKEKILALLQSRFTGVRKDGLGYVATILALSADTEEKAKEVVDKITADQITAFITDWRKEADAEVSKANKTYEDGLRKKYDFTEKKAPEVTTPPVTTEAGNIDAAAIQKLITDSITAATKPLLEQINTFKAGETTKTRLQALNEKLKECKDENYKNLVLKNFAHMQFETDEAFTEYLTETETDIKTANQNVADLGLGAQSRPFVPNSTTSGKEASDEEIKAIMDMLPV